MVSLVVGGVLAAPLLRASGVARKRATYNEQPSEESLAHDFGTGNFRMIAFFCSGVSAGLAAT